MKLDGNQQGSPYVGCALMYGLWTTPVTTPITTPATTSYSDIANFDKIFIQAHTSTTWRDNSTYVQQQNKL
jgi:hypothetical protein